MSHGWNLRRFCRNYVHLYWSVVLFKSSIRCQQSTLLLIVISYIQWWLHILFPLKRKQLCHSTYKLHFDFFCIATTRKICVQSLKHFHRKYINIDMYFYAQNDLLCRKSQCINCSCVSIMYFLLLMLSPSSKNRSCRGWLVLLHRMRIRQFCNF